MNFNQTGSQHVVAAQSQPVSIDTGWQFGTDFGC